MAMLRAFFSVTMAVKWNVLVLMQHLWPETIYGSLLPDLFFPS